MSAAEFIGSTILGVRIADDKHALLFQTDRGDVIARTDGDCCSYTWIEHVSLPARGFPAVVLSSHRIPMPDRGSPSEDECIEYYGHKIVTDKGELLIDFRNESNGYYGGSLEWPWDGSYYGGVYGQNVSSEKWVDVGAVQATQP